MLLPCSRCTSCKEEHPNPITLNLYQTSEITGSRGEATLVIKCKNCKKESSVNAFHSTATSAATPDLNKPELYRYKDSGSAKVMLKLDPRGLDFIKFIPDGKFSCKGVKKSGEDDEEVEPNSTTFQDVDLEEGEWYDYDDQAANEVSITNAEWSFVKIK